MRCTQPLAHQVPVWSLCWEKVLPYIGSTTTTPTIAPKARQRAMTPATLATLNYSSNAPHTLHHSRHLSVPFVPLTTPAPTPLRPIIPTPPTAANPWPLTTTTTTAHTTQEATAK